MQQSVQSERRVSFFSGIWLRVISVAGILLGTFLVFLPTLRYVLVYDDFEQIVTNPRITSWSYFPGYFTTHLWAHSPLQQPNYYRPLFLIWLRLVDSVLGPPGSIWHLASVLAHLGTVVAVLLLIRRLTGDFRGAAVAGALFAIYPIHTEAVAWVSSVEDPLLTIFAVLSVLFYVRRRGPISVLSLLSALLAIFTKEAGIVVPALILAYEWTQSNFKNAFLGAAPYALPVLIYAALRMNALGSLATGVPPNMTVSQMILTWPAVLAAYGRHLLWPVHLSVSYEVAMGHAIWPVALLGVVAAGMFWMLRHCSSTVRFGAAWFAITFAPALAVRYLLIGDYVHDRYLYLPSVGLALIVAVGLSKIRFTPAWAIAAGGLAIACCFATRSDLAIWKDDISLFQRAVEAAPHNPYAKNNLADAYLKAHRENEAYPLLEQAIELDPGYRLGYYNMARYYQQIGNSAEAERYFTISDEMYYQQPSGTTAR